MEQIIVRYNKGDIISNSDLYSYIEALYILYEPFIVCNVSKDEFENMKNDIRLENDSFKLKDYKNYNPVMGYDLKTDRIYFNNYNLNKERIGTYYFYEGDLIYDSNDYEFGTIAGYINHNIINNNYIIYTTNTYDDVIKHYKNEVLSEDKKKELIRG